MSKNCENKLAKECFAELETFINGLEDKRGALISVLHKAQEIFGYLPTEVQTFVAEKLNVSLAKVYGVVSFYSVFTMVPKGKHPIAVCMGTAWYVDRTSLTVQKYDPPIYMIAINVVRVDQADEGNTSIADVKTSRFFIKTPDLTLSKSILSIFVNFTW